MRAYVLRLVALQAVVILGAFAQSIPSAPDSDVKRYSYICVKSSQDLCLGISPGDGDPFFNATNPPFLLQLKRRERNEAAATDYKKTRWDVRFQENVISLSRFPDLCISLPTPNTNPNELALYPCNDVFGDRRLGKFSLGFNTNVNEESEIRVAGTTDCVTVVSCNAGTLGFCDPAAENVPQRFRSGTFVKVKKCWDAPDGVPTWRAAQTFVQALDCAVGCPPMLQTNDVCDMPCANHQCNLDNGHCLTAAPTPPTFSPSAQPTRLPSQAPSSAAPSRSPSSSAPSTSPTLFPTLQPTSRIPSEAPTPKPTKIPTTFAPSLNPTTPPTKRPSHQPTNEPTLKPSGAPSIEPTSSPSKAPVVVPILQKDPPTAIPTTPPPESLNAVVAVAVAVPLLLLLLLCLVLLLVARERRKRRQRGAKSWNSLIDVNQAAFVEHHKNMRKPLCTRVREYICCVRTPQKPPSVTTLSSHLPVDHIIVTASPDAWQPVKLGNFKNKKQRPKLVGS